MLLGTPTLYLEHSAVSNETWWPRIDAVLATGQVRLALSLWNLVEIGLGSDRKQQDRRLAFLEQYDPLWIVERVAVQRQEVQRFLWQHRFGGTPPDLCVITPHLSVVDSYLSGARTQIGLTARGWIDGVDFARLDGNKELAPDALRRLQAVDRKTFKRRQNEVFRAWINGLIPKLGPDGKPFTVTQRAELLTWCEARQKAFFDACPSLAVEDVLTAARTANPGRKPQRSDGIDLMHTVIALAYCDYFLIGDGFARTCATQAIKALTPRHLASVYDDPARLHSDLTMPQPRDAARAGPLA
jgi:hypothetical protein